MELTAAEARRIVWEDHEDWEETDRWSEGSVGRWSEGIVGVFLHKPSGRHYQLTWTVGATEMQEEKPFEYSEPDPVEVEKKSVAVEKWMPVERGMSCTPPLDPPGLIANVHHDLLTEAVSQAVRGWSCEVPGGELGAGANWSIEGELTRLAGPVAGGDLVDALVDAVVRAVEGGAP